MNIVKHIPEADYALHNVCEKEYDKTDVRLLLEKYDAKLERAGESSMDSFPIGNGDITANVWTRKDGLSFYIGKSDAWSEATRLLKLGAVKATFTPNPFEKEDACVMKLHLYEGLLEITAGEKGRQLQIRMWADANSPVIRTEVTGDYDFDMEVSAVVWRDREVQMDEKTRHSYYGISECPGQILRESADHFPEAENKLIWCHYNEHSYYKEITEMQRAENAAQKDPYLGRCFGAAAEGQGLVKTGKTSLRTSKKGNCFAFSVYPYTCQCADIAEWEAGLEKQMETLEQISSEEAFQAHTKWWKQFWNQSYIFIDGDEAAETVTRGYLMQRYMQALQGRGSYPIKFNGGTLNFDYNDQNADYRMWGPAYWFQNTRHLYWNMLASGDFEMMMPFFKMYLNMLPVQKAVTEKYYGHSGAFFPETVYFTGLYTPDNFGWGNEGVETENCYIRYYWQGGLELSAMMLKYFSYTKDYDFAGTYLLPIAEEVIKFYSQHYRREDGKIAIEPAHALETYWDDVSNPAEVISGLKCVLTGLLNLPLDLISEKDRSEWSCLLDELPELETEKNGDRECIRPAGEYGATRYNNENPELYPVFPYRLFGVGQNNQELARDTYSARKSVFDYCWSQNGIHAACLGLIEEAQKAVLSHFSNIPDNVAFPGFWSSGNDWMPDLDNGGSAMMALQNMLVQHDGEQLHLFPAWPSEWKVKFKLYAEDETVVCGSYE